MPVKKKLQPFLRWMIQADMAQVMAIENDTYQDPWSEIDFLKHIKDRHGVAQVVTLGEAVVGYIAFTTAKKLQVNNLVVAEWHRRDGIGSFILDSLKNKLAHPNRIFTAIVAQVSEWNLPAQLFLKDQAFLCNGKVSYPEDSIEPDRSDEYVFEYVRSD